MAYFLPMHRVAFIVYPGFELLDTSGPISVFTSANRALGLGGKPPFYAVELLSPSGGPVTSSSGVAVHTQSLDAGAGPTGFGVGGKVTTDFGGADPEAANGVAIQVNGRIVAVGGAVGNVALARYAFDGTPDATFGTGGKLTADFTGTDVGEAVVLQVNGGIVVAGTTSAGDDFALARYVGDVVISDAEVPPGLP